MRTALITGVTGQTGSYLADLLTADGGWDVHGAVRPGDRTLPWDPERKKQKDKKKKR